jgi:hypothetical protein
VLLQEVSARRYARVAELAVERARHEAERASVQVEPEHRRLSVVAVWAMLDGSPRLS